MGFETWRSLLPTRRAAGDLSQILTYLASVGYETPTFLREVLELRAAIRLSSWSNALKGENTQELLNEEQGVCGIPLMIAYDRKRLFLRFSTIR